jgi:hypothetical protein
VRSSHRPEKHFLPGGGDGGEKYPIPALTDLVIRFSHMSSSNDQIE